MSGRLSHQQFAVQRTIEGHRLDEIGKSTGNFVARARVKPPQAALADRLNADAIPLPFSRVVRWVETCEITVFHGMRQHNGTEEGCGSFFWPRRIAFQPGEQRKIGLGQPVPDLLDFGYVHLAQFGQRLFGEARRDADAQATRDQFDDGIARGNAGCVQQLRQHGGAIRAAGGLQRADHIGKRWLMVGGLVGWWIGPHQGDCLGEIADIVIGISEQHRIHAFGHQHAQHCRFYRGDRQVAGDCRQRQPPVGIRRGREIIDEQFQLAVARRRQHQPVEQFGKGFHSREIPVNAVHRRISISLVLVADEMQWPRGDAR